MAALALGFICVGSADPVVAADMLQLLSERSEVELKDPNMRLVALGLALVYLGQLHCFIQINELTIIGTQEKSEAMYETVRIIPEPFGSMTATLISVCAYAGTGNVLKIQNLLHDCCMHYDTPAKVC